MEQTLRFGGVPSQHIDLVWEQLEPFIAEAFSHTRGEFTLAEVREAVKDRQMQVWVLWDLDTNLVNGVGLTRLEQYEEFIICHILVASGGSEAEWRHVLPVIESWAMQKGARFLRWWGRRGTEKFGKRSGFVTDYVVMTKELDEQFH